MIVTAGNGAQFDICDACGHLKSSLKAMAEGGRVVRTCACGCHPPAAGLTPGDLRQLPWHEPASKSGTRLATPYGARQWTS